VGCVSHHDAVLRSHQIVRFNRSVVAATHPQAVHIVCATSHRGCGIASCISTRVAGIIGFKDVEHAAVGPHPRERRHTQPLPVAHAAKPPRLRQFGPQTIDKQVLFSRSNTCKMAPHRHTGCLSTHKRRPVRSLVNVQRAAKRSPRCASKITRAAPLAISTTRHEPRADGTHGSSAAELTLAPSHVAVGAVGIDAHSKHGRIERAANSHGGCAGSCCGHCRCHRCRSR